MITAGRVNQNISKVVFGEPPNLSKLDDGDVKYSTDFRDIYASLLEQVLLADGSRMLDGWKGRLKGLF